MEELRQGMQLLLTAELSRPMVLEVLTDHQADEHNYREYYNSL
jgi:hypothetical protein